MGKMYSRLYKKIYSHRADQVRINKNKLWFKNEYRITKIEKKRTFWNKTKSGKIEKRDEWKTKIKVRIVKKNWRCNK